MSDTDSTADAGTETENEEKAPTSTQRGPTQGQQIVALRERMGRLETQAEQLVLLGERVGRLETQALERADLEQTARDVMDRLQQLSGDLATERRELYQMVQTVVVALAPLADLVQILSAQPVAAATPKPPATATRPNVVQATPPAPVPAAAPKPPATATRANVVQSTPPAAAPAAAPRPPPSAVRSVPVQATAPASAMAPKAAPGTAHRVSFKPPPGASRPHPIPAEEAAPSTPGNPLADIEAAIARARAGLETVAPLARGLIEQRIAAWTAEIESAKALIASGM